MYLSFITIKDYFLFVKSLFKNQKIEVIDEQRNFDKGSPDFRLIVEGGFEFYIEFKSKTDAVRPAQLQWMGNNQEKEMWFLILEEIETLIESEEMWYRQNKFLIESKEIGERLSTDVCNMIKNKLQNN